MQSWDLNLYKPMKWPNIPAQNQALSLKAEMEDKAEAEKQEAILKKKAEAAEDMRCTIMRLVVVSLGIFSIVFLAFYLYIMTNHQWQTKTKIV